MNDTNEQHLQIIVETVDKDWMDALNALTGWDTNTKAYTNQNDPSKLAELLMSGLPIPQEVSRFLATMLNPHPSWKGGRLVVRIPESENWAKNWKRAKLISEVQEMNSKLIKEGIGFDARSYQIRDHFKIPLSSATKYMGMDNKSKVEEFGLPVTPAIK